MSVIGIDLGSAYSIIATVGRGAVTVVRNEISERLTPSLVAFTDKERLLGEAALTQIKSNYKNTCRNFKNLLGRRIDDVDLQIEEKYSLCKYAEAENRTVGFQVNYKGENRIFNASVITAAFLTKLKEIAEKSTGVAAVDVVIACPGWFTDTNRRALLAAAEIAGLNCRRVISEHTATALDYGIYRSREFLENEAYRVVFVDMGHANSSVSIVEFVRGSLKVLAEVSYRDLGGRDIDTIIAEHFAHIFFKQHNIDLMKNAKTRLKLEDQANRLKKILSANADAQFHVECAYEEYDCSGSMSRNEFEILCSTTILPKFEKLMGEALERCGVSCEMIHAVEIVGGCTRIPWVQNAIAKFFKKDPSKTLSSDECVARGCALQAAMCSSAYKVREFSCWERTFHPIAVGWEGSACLSSKNNECNPNENTLSNGTTEKKSAIVITAGMVSNVVKKLFFERPSSFDVSAFYAEPQKLPPGTSPDLGKCKIILNPLPDGSNRTVALRCKLNFHGLFKFDQAELIETEEVEEIVKEKRLISADSKETEENKINSNIIEENSASSDNISTSQSKEENDIKKNAPQPKYEEVEVRKKTKRTKKTELKTIVEENELNLRSDQIKELKENEIVMANDDRIHAETKEKMNELEAYIYNMRNKLNDSLKDYVQADVMKFFLEELEKAENWLYENTEAMKSAFVHKIEELEKIGNPIENRYKSYIMLNESINKALQIIHHQKLFLSNTDEKFAHINIQDKQQLINEAMNIEKWIAEMNAKQATVPLYENVIFTAEEINNKLHHFCNMSNKIMYQPKPTLPTAENKENNMDVEKPEVPGSTPSKDEAANTQNNNNNNTENTEENPQ